MKHSCGTRIQDRLGQKLGFGVYVYEFPLTGDFFSITFNTNQTKNILKVFWLNDTKNSVCCKILTLFPMGYLKGFSSSHTHMKTPRENILLVHSTSILKGISLYTTKSRGIGGVVGLGEGTRSFPQMYHKSQQLLLVETKTHPSEVGRVHTIGV